MPFNQQMNVPVDLTLKSTADGPRMAARPVPELETLRREKRSWKDVALQAGSDPLVLGDIDLLDLELAFRPGTAERVTLEIRGTPLVYDVRKAELTLKGVRVPLSGSGEVVRLRVLIDRGSIEVFGGDGLAALCVAALPSREKPSMRLSASGGAATLESAEAWNLAPCWR
jgi:fructan beta-fructosidase